MARAVCPSCPEQRWLPVVHRSPRSRRPERWLGVREAQGRRRFQLLCRQETPNKGFGSLTGFIIKQFTREAFLFLLVASVLSERALLCLVDFLFVPALGKLRIWTCRGEGTLPQDLPAWTLHGAPPHLFRHIPFRREMSCCPPWAL